MNQISLVMIVRNEERYLARCLESAVPYVDEIVIVDTGSEDHTKEIARQFGASLYDYAWNHDFSEARNYALSLSSSDWNLVLDADEYITEIDIIAVRKFMNKVTRPSVGRVQILHAALQGEEKSEFSAYTPRLIPRGKGFEGRIHEQVDPTLDRVTIPITVYHDGYLNADKSARNIPLLLQSYNQDEHNAYYAYMLAKEYKGIEAIEEACHYFERSYQLLSGQERYAPNVVVDYIYALMASKRLFDAYEIIEREHPWVQEFPDYFFVSGIYYLELALSDPTLTAELLPRIEASYKRCLVIGETTLYDSICGTGSYAALHNLGVLYEVLGRNSEALECYRESASQGYLSAKKRLHALEIG